MTRNNTTVPMCRWKHTTKKESNLAVHQQKTSDPHSSATLACFSSRRHHQRIPIFLDRIVDLRLGLHRSSSGPRIQNGHHYSETKSDPFPARRSREQGRDPRFATTLLESCPRDDTSCRPSLDQLLSTAPPQVALAIAGDRLERCHSQQHSRHGKGLRPTNPHMESDGLGVSRKHSFIRLTVPCGSVGKRSHQAVFKYLGKDIDMRLLQHACMATRNTVYLQSFGGNSIPT